MSKLTQKISSENINILEDKFNSRISKDLKYDYDPQKIENLLKQYGFKEEYNFLEDINATIRVKDQANCGCCWAHASTTALSYRYQKLGLDIDLSPQDALSCYIKDCDAGNYLIDPQLNLVKNGTVTEECLPFSSADGIIKEKCPNLCKDDSIPKKYYSQNAYMTQDYYTSDYLYDIIILIIDQLTTKGPVVSGIKIYDDFMKLHKDPEKCKNTIYSYDGKSKFSGGHAVTIVGYGFLNGKYYWLIQNSWGESACDNGFIKIEFGQINVESVAFSDPYIPEEGATPIKINLSYETINEYCDLKIITPSSYNNWKNSLDIQFKDEKESEFNFQCGTTNIPSPEKEWKKLSCYFEYQYFSNLKGDFQFKGYKSLGIDNEFVLDDTFKGKSFTFWGEDSIEPLLTDIQYYYISEEGSRILFQYESLGNDDGKITPIYPNINIDTALKECHRVLIGGLSLVYCDIKNEEIDYFEDFSQISDQSDLVYNIDCGIKITTFTYVYKLDKTKYPVFKIKNFIIPRKSQITDKDVLILVSEIEGSFSYFKEEQIFITLTSIENKRINTTYLMLCLAEIPGNINEEFNISCIFDLDVGESPRYDNIYVNPYIIPYNTKYPYEIFLNETIKGEKNYGPEPEPDPEPDSSLFLKLWFSIFITLLMWL